MPTRTQHEATMSLPEAAKALGVSWGRAWRLLLMQKLQGSQDGRGHWCVTVSSVERLKNGSHGAPRVPQPAAP